MISIPLVAKDPDDEKERIRHKLGNRECPDCGFHELWVTFYARPYPHFAVTCPACGWGEDVAL